MMCLLNLAQIAEQTGALLSVSCRLVRSLISSNSLKYLSGCIFVPVNRAREKNCSLFLWLPVEEQGNYTQQCALLNTNLTKSSRDFQF